MINKHYHFCHLALASNINYLVQVTKLACTRPPKLPSMLSSAYSLKKPNHVNKI